MAAPAPPRHVACIMDGNGRWARNRGLARSHGHLAAAGTAVREVVDAALAEGVEWLTLFAFSTENWSRPPEEVGFLVRNLAPRLAEEELDRLNERGVRLRLLTSGESRLPQEVAARLRRAEEVTRGNDRLHLTVALDYGGRQAIADAARTLARRGAPAEEITPELLTGAMRHPELPDVDALIRTGGECRLSNFLLWHCAYAELIFLDVLWPDFRAAHFRGALDLYAQRRRRFGGVEEEAPATSADPSAGAPPGAGPSTPPAPAPVPGLSVALTLPGAVAAHFAAALVDGLWSTARFARERLGGGPPGPAARAEPPS
ncbi:polyprenyl diphosphate synthase [Streptomyces sp. DSM 44917]|uniref:Isoprenyl transferase n=1 Tax=Streptomyces boetiae TaxID=3075541 RepID=A0ABU2L4E3_9ACTN|nr:polyprenyl diphosphate synthase [Streptomyces sp. DSM 44917]MDT0306387.1 polyprenyl diphosphate synthase [Streptomyces sp. DSM 44917]